MGLKRCYIKSGVYIFLILILVIFLYEYMWHLLEKMWEGRVDETTWGNQEVVIIKQEHYFGDDISSNKSTKIDNVNVVLASNEERLGAMVALMNSIQENTKNKDILAFYLITEAKSTRHAREWLLSARNLRNLKFTVKAFNESWVEGKIKVRGWRTELAHPINYARYYVPRIFPELETERYIYLDDDIIVQGDILELFRAHIKPHHLAAFSEDCSSVSKRFNIHGTEYSSYINFKNPSIRKLGLHPKNCSFNAGVFIVKSGQEWIEHNITEQLEHWLILNTQENVYGSLPGGGGSQPPLMIVFAKLYSALNPMWHIRQLGWKIGSSYSQPFLRRARLLHWSGHHKPWLLPHPAHHMLWYKYYIEDPWGKWMPSYPIRRNKSKTE